MFCSRLTGEPTDTRIPHSRQIFYWTLRQLFMCKETFGQDAGGAHQPPAWPYESLSTHDSLTNREDRWTDKQRLDTLSGPAHVQRDIWPGRGRSASAPGLATRVSFNSRFIDKQGRSLDRQTKTRHREWTSLSPPWLVPGDTFLRSFDSKTGH